VRSHLRIELGIFPDHLQRRAKRNEENSDVALNYIFLLSKIAEALKSVD